MFIWKDEFGIHFFFFKNVLNYELDNIEKKSGWNKVTSETHLKVYLLALYPTKEKVHKATFTIDLDGEQTISRFKAEFKKWLRHCFQKPVKDQLDAYKQKMMTDASELFFNTETAGVVYIPPVIGMFSDVHDKYDEADDDECRLKYWSLGVDSGETEILSMEEESFSQQEIQKLIDQSQLWYDQLGYFNPSVLLNTTSDFNSSSNVVEPTTDSESNDSQSDDGLLYLALGLSTGMALF